MVDHLEMKELCGRERSVYHPRRLSENPQLLRYPHPSSLRRTSMYASFLGISEALYLEIFHQPPNRTGSPTGF
jgi:hypothetical protein